MPQPPNPLPKFDNPPVVETVMGLYFRPLHGFTLVQRALFWSQFKDQFPTVIEKPPVDETREEFGVEVAQAHSIIRWELTEELPSPRIWGKSRDGKHTIQIQSDALFVNWERDASNPDKYWHFDSRRQDFAEKLRNLESFISQAGIGAIEPTSCFVTYVNHVELLEKGDLATTLSRLLTFWSNETSDGALPLADNASLKFSFAWPENRGRLHVSVIPGFNRKEKKFLIRLELTARGAPANATIPAALEWIELGHESVVRGFASLTRPEMHRLWGRTQ